MKLKIFISCILSMVQSLGWGATCHSSAINACVHVPKPSIQTCRAYHEELYTLRCSRDAACLRIESQNCAFTGVSCARIGSLCHRIIHKSLSHKKIKAK